MEPSAVIPTAEQLPTTVIGLVAFMFIVAMLAVFWVIRNNNKTITTFMTYIEKKNGNLERATKLFTETIEEQAMRHRDAMINQNDRHKQMMDDMAARLEAGIPLKK